jgi:hypothetical protein
MCFDLLGKCVSDKNVAKVSHYINVTNCFSALFRRHFHSITPLQQIVHGIVHRIARVDGHQHRQYVISRTYRCMIPCKISCYDIVYVLLLRSWICVGFIYICENADGRASLSSGSAFTKSYYKKYYNHIPCVFYEQFLVCCRKDINSINLEFSNTYYTNTTILH